MPYLENEMRSVIRRRMSEIEKEMYTVTGVLEITAYRTKEPVPFEERTSGEKLTLHIGDSWGELWDCAWFRFTGAADDGDGRETAVMIDINGELCIFDENGCPVRGLTNVSSEFDLSLGKPGKRIYHLPRGTREIDLWADAGCNDLFGNRKEGAVIKDAFAVLVNEDVRGLYYDLEVLTELMDELGSDSARAKSILFTAYDAVKDLGTVDNTSARTARAALAPELLKKGGDPSLVISASGHSHLDLAWLWPVRETKRKAARTFATAVSMLDRYPDYVFGATQPQAYAWVKELYPALYAKVKEKVAEGRWEPQGAMWVEPDTNIAGGESLIRQILYGTKFFSEEFGIVPDAVYLPDVFGYSGALPQILKKSGIKYFLTIKLSWNTYNMFPHHTFLWHGIDGSEVIVHMPPEGVYNSSAAPRAAKFIEKNFIDKGRLGECMMLFGIGDGGGGPGMEHLERLSREKDLSGMAPIRQEFTENFFKRLEKEKDKLRSEHGELYLEKHQGTYTSQGRNKAMNRLTENLLRETEFAEVLSGSRCLDKAALDEIWKETLLYQFHDILPGSSIDRVYDESLERYGILTAKLNEMADNIYRRLFTRRGTTAVNTAPFERTEWIKTGNGYVLTKIEPMGYAVPQGAAAARFNVYAKDGVLKNDRLEVRIARDGSTVSVRDESREYLAAPSNILTLYEDTGDAWDFSPLVREGAKCVIVPDDMRYYTDGPDAVCECVYTFGSSKLKQKTILRDGSGRIDYVTEADWRETHKMLRASFVPDVHTDRAACGIQFGHIFRNAHSDTLLDAAKHELCAHRWIDMSQTDHGLSVLCGTKYGYGADNGVLDIGLLRSPTAPGRTADKGEHRFTYSLYPHSGTCTEGGVMREAYLLDMPVRTVDLGAAAHNFSFIKSSDPHAVTETVKFAEDGSGDIIIRIYEDSGASLNASFELGIDIKHAVMTDMKENGSAPVEHGRHSFSLSLAPFEIVTVRLTPENGAV